MADPIVYQFVAVDSDEIVRAFESHVAAAEKSASKTESAYKRTAKSAADTASKQKAEADKTASALQKDADKSAAAQVKADDRRAKSAQKTEDARWHAVEKASAKIQREFDKEADAAEKAAKRKVKAEEDASKARRAAVSKGVKYAVGLGAAAVGFAGARAVLGKARDAVGESMDSQGAANRISIAGGRTVDPTMLRKELEATAAAHAGQSTASVASGVSSYQEHRGGDKGNALDEARRFAGVIATVASATGRGADEIGEAAALITKNGGAKTTEQMGDALAQLAAHARESGEPLSSAISHLDKLGAAAKRFGISGPNGEKQTGALQAIASQGLGAAGADQGVVALLDKLKSDKTARMLKSKGVDPYKDENGNVKDPRAVLAGIFGKVGRKDSASDKTSEISKILGPKAGKAIDPLKKAYEAGYGGATGSNDDRVKAGVDAMLAAFDKAAAQTGDYADMKKSAAQAEGTASAQMGAAWEKVVASMGTEVTPKLAALGTQLANSPAVFKALEAAIGVASKALSGFAFVLKQYFPDSEQKYDSGEVKKKIGQDLGFTSADDAEKAIQMKARGEYEKNQAHPPPPMPAPHGPNGSPSYMTSPASTGQQQPFVMTGVDTAHQALAVAAGNATSKLEKLGAVAGSVYGTPRQHLDGT